MQEPVTVGEFIVNIPYRLTYWPPSNFIAEHYRKEKIWVK